MTKPTVSKHWRKPAGRQRSGLNLTRTTLPCYNNTTLGNRLYTQRKGPNVTCKNCSYKCRLWTLCHTIQHRAVLIIFPVNLQTIIIIRMLSSGREGTQADNTRAAKLSWLENVHLHPFLGGFGNFDWYSRSDRFGFGLWSGFVCRSVHASWQVSVCSSYDLCHPDKHPDRYTDIIRSAYMTSSASWANKMIITIMMMTNIQIYVCATALPNTNILALMNDDDQLRSSNAVANCQLNLAKLPFTKYH